MCFLMLLLRPCRHAPSLQELGYVLEQRGDWAQAARLFSQAAKVNAVQRSSAGRPAAQRRQKPPPGAMQRRF